MWLLWGRVRYRDKCDDGQIELVSIYGNEMSGLGGWAGAGTGFHQLRLYAEAYPSQLCILLSLGILRRE